MFLNKNDVDLLNGCDYLKDGFNCLCLEFKIFLIEQNEKYLEYIENEEESILERILDMLKGSLIFNKV